MPDLTLETGCDGHVIGIDEAGRGPWAGPVTVTALWLNPRGYGQLPDDINDSKKLKPARRASLAAFLQMPPQLYCTISKDVNVIDQWGVVQTTLMAMAEAARGVISQLQGAGFVGPAYALIDGPLLPKNMPCPSQPVVRGDSKSLSIAAASIIAKHSRDLIMQELDTDWPAYGWRQNNGYGTHQHQQALAIHGVSPHHRRSFAPIRRLCEAANDTNE
jgi:ribonuclease HII